MKIFNLKQNSQSLLTKQMILNLNPNSSLIFSLKTFIELDKDIDIELYLLINDNNKLFHIGSINITIDDLINLNNQRILNLNLLQNQLSLYFYLIRIYIFLFYFSEECIHLFKYIISFKYKY